MIHLSKTLFLLLLVAAVVGGGIGLGAAVYYSRAPEGCENPYAHCSQQREIILFLDHFNSSLDWHIHLLILNKGYSSTTLADISIDNSNVNYSLSPRGTESGCSGTTRVIAPSAYCFVNALSPNPNRATHSLRIETTLGLVFRG